MGKLHALTIAAAITLGATTGTASAATIINFTATQGTVGTFATLSSGQSLANDAGTYTSGTHPFVFLENTAVNGSTTTQVFLFHFDSPGNNGGDVAGTFGIQFDPGTSTVNILPNQLSDLDVQDLLYGVPGVTYATGFSGRGFEGSNDSLMLGALTGNIQTVNYTMRGNGNNLDEVRFTVTTTAPTTTSLGAVPEPATWAMMIVGFAALGMAMRSRKRKDARVNFA